MNNSGCSCRKHTIKAIGFPSPLPPISYRLSAMTIAEYQEGGMIESRESYSGLKRRDVAIRIAIKASQGLFHMLMDF